MALNIRHCGPRLGEQEIPWPNLKALYVREGEEAWLDLLPEFEKLQILSLENLGPEIAIINWSIIENIAACRHLQVLNLDFGEFRDEEELFDIARCCPLLRKFSVRCIDFRADPSLGEDLLLGLLPALPHLEFLALGVKFQLPGALLQDISRHCPRLTVLDMPNTQLCLSRTDDKTASALAVRKHALCENLFRESAIFDATGQTPKRCNRVAQDIPETSRDTMPRGRLLPVYARR